MKVATIAMGIGLGAFLMTGCGGGPTDDDKSDIVGTWVRACYQPGMDSDKGTHRTYTWKFTQKEFSYSATYYSDENCTQDPVADGEGGGTYTIGGKAEDSSGKETTELNFVYNKWDGKDINSTKYTMYRFDADGGLLVAGKKDERGGETPATRKNYIGTKWKGATKQ